jgi:hypothetical protein
MTLSAAYLKGVQAVPGPVRMVQDEVTYIT